MNSKLHGSAPEHWWAAGFVVGALAGLAAGGEQAWDFYGCGFFGKIELERPRLGFEEFAQGQPQNPMSIRPQVGTLSMTCPGKWVCQLGDAGVVPDAGNMRASAGRAPMTLRHSPGSARYNRSSKTIRSSA
ncbi:MAG: hypothetical protein Ct9H300mP7_6140 [Verrucomicrobiota bacterium]|nr:MAG: hypothetical protein Ct9H300mP7_6140 [Verrucomicrobiota bacterium]